MQVLFWSFYAPGRLDQNRNIRGRPQDVVCRLVIARHMFLRISYFVEHLQKVVS